MTKQRLDLLMLERGLAATREKARAMIMAGEVLVDGNVVDKPGSPVKSESEIMLVGKPRFVSRGGDKLAAAIAAFPVEVTGRIAADVGASTGGFTDCLLQAQVAKVYAIDVGYGQIALTLRNDPRVVVIERTNARHLEQLDEAVSMVVIDASFISLRLLLPTIKGWLTPQADIITLIKPQFEAGPNAVGKGGVVRDTAVHRRVLLEVLSFASNIGLQPAGLITSPLKGPAGNTEFLAWLRWGAEASSADIEALIQSVAKS
ncbi:MAG: TlyA family RNA methyltransferase [Chloroflexota bacterium]|nr:TlyA family RNA methyltransferase [Chloroflexota bacterium]